MDLNKVYPKDSYPLPRIDKLVDVTARYALLSFMDAFSDCHYIPLHRSDQEKTAFIVDRGILLQGHVVRPQKCGGHPSRFVNKVFHSLIVKNVEVYVDDMIAKARVTHGIRPT